MTIPHTTPADTTPAPARQHGSPYDTLALPEVAVLITAELVAISADPDPETVFPARLRYATTVCPHLGVIEIAVYGLTDAELAAPYTAPADAPCPASFAEIIGTVADHYSPDNPGRRFTVTVSTLDEATQRRLAVSIGGVHPCTARSYHDLH
jgi:hypothetical protein